MSFRLHHSTVLRLLDVVHENEGIDRHRLAVLLNRGEQHVCEATRQLRALGLIAPASSLVPTVGFADWHRMTDRTREIFAWAIDVRPELHQCHRDIGACTSKLYEHMARMRRVGAIEPQRGIWSDAEVARRCDLAWDSLTAWERGMVAA